MGGNRISLFLSIALFALLSIGITNASGLSITSNTITTPIDYPQNAIYTINGISGGVLPYTFNAYIAASPNSLTINGASVSLPVFLGSNTFSPSATYNDIIITITPNSISPDSILITAYNGIVGAANVLFSNTISTGTNTIYGAWTFNAFFADSTGATANYSNTLTINPTPTITLTPSNTVLDSGQTETYTMQVSGGTGPFDVKLYNITGSTPAVVNSVIISSPSESNTISFTVNSPTSGTTFTYNAMATDKGTTTPYVFNSISNTITVNPALSVSISPTTNTLDVGQTLALTTNVIGGTPGFSIAYSGNDLCGTLSATSNTLSADGTNTIVFTPNSAITSACTANIMASVTDSATTNSIVSVNSVITVDPMLSAPTITSPAATNTLDEDQPITITAQVSGGTAPYTYNFIISQYNNPSNIIAFSGPVSNSLTSNSFVWTTNAIGTFVANVIVTDSASTPETANSVYSANIVVNAAPTATSLTPSNTILDSGQYVTYNVVINGGTLPITANLIYVSGPQSNNAINGNVPGNVLQTITLPAGSAEPNTITFNPFELTTPGSYTFNVVAVDSASTPVTFNAVANTITVNLPFGVPTITSPTATNTLDEGQSITITASVSGGTAPYTYTFIVSNELNPSNIIATNIISSSSGSESFGWTTNAIGTFVANVIVTDHASTPETTNSAYSANIVVNPAPSISVQPSSATIDSGQSIKLTSTVTGGTGKYSWQWYATSSNSPISSGTGTTATYTASPTSTTEYYVVFTDTGTSQGATPAATAQSNTATVTVNPTPTATLLTPSNTILDSGQYVTYNVVINGGTLPITANLIYVSGPQSNNAINGNVPGNVLQTITLPAGSAEPNTITFNPFELTTPGSYTFNVVAVDSASTPVTFNAVANTITVDPAPYITLTATPSNSIMYGKPFTVNAVITGGTGNFAVYWYLNGNSITPTAVSTNAETSNTIALPAAGSYTYIVSANDIGTSSVYTLTQVTNTIIVAQNNTLTASSSGNPGSSYYSYPVTITFTGTPTINHQAKWSLYVNGQLYGTTNSVITYYEQFAPPGTYNFVFNLTSDANYTPYTYKTSLVISYQPTGAYGVNTTVTTVTTTSTTTSIPTTSVTTTIPPSQKALNITSTISSSSPLVLSLPNTHSTLSIYTTSTASTPIVANIANVTQQVSSLAKPQPNYTLINAVNVSIKTTAPITAFFVEHYPCSIPSDLVAPYIFKNNTWLAITNYTVNATACTVSFYIPSDPIVAIFEKSVPTTTTTSIATTIPTTIPTTIYYPSPSPKPRSPIVVEALILIIILIIIILVLLYYYKFLHRRYHGFKR